MNHMRIETAKAVVTGGASGLGYAVAEKIAQSGAQVCLFDMNAQVGQASAARLGNKAHFFACDVSNEQQVNAAMQAAADAMGGITLLVNCAGIIGAGRVLGRDGPMKGEFFSRVVNVNLVGTFLCDKAAAAHMQRNDPDEDGQRGLLIHTASVAAYEGQIGQAAYSATKAAVVGMTLPIARELASFGIRCMTIAPGTFHTPMVDELPEATRVSLGAMVPFPKRLGKPEEFARLVIAAYEITMLNGESIRIDGAIRMQPK